jgi:CheY-like chemotaxis protein
MGALAPILIIDDDPDDLFIFRRLLAKGGVKNKIIAFEDGAAAIDYLELESKNQDQRFAPCAVLTDLDMPEVTGVDLVVWVRAHPILKNLPVIIISSSESPHDEKRAMEAGATRFLRKYPSSNDLRKLIDGLNCTLPS